MYYCRLLHDNGDAVLGTCNTKRLDGRKNIANMMIDCKAFMQQEKKNSYVLVKRKCSHHECILVKCFLNGYIVEYETKRLTI